MIVIVGAGMGGLAAAAWLAKRGRRVLVLEARPGPGGLASGVEAEGVEFDAGPYVLLDRPGLEWVFDQLGESIDARLRLRRVEEVYRVEREEGPAITICADLEATAAGLERTWPGAGALYAAFVREMAGVLAKLRPLQFRGRPGVGSLVRAGALGAAPFLLSSLERVLAKTGLPREVRDAVSIWTHVAGQRGIEAPSPMAFVPALIHGPGAWIPEGGIRRVPAALEAIAKAAGAEFRYGARVRRIRGGLGVELDGETIAAEAVISNAHGVGTYLDLAEGVPDRFARRLRALPLQSPGVCAYLQGRESSDGPYLSFRLPRDGPCRLLVRPGRIDPAAAGTARLLGPLEQAWAEPAGRDAQLAYLDGLLGEAWWRTEFTDARVLLRRAPTDWGAAYGLHRDSMNPVMTAAFMRRGRLAHRSPVLPGLFLAGSSTHPGQWVSFAAISGILAAQELAC